MQTVEVPWGRALDLEALRRVARSGAFKVLAVVHAETSTGVLQDLTPLRAIADEAGALLLVDTVTSLGGVSVEVDTLGIDVTFSATQKCLSCPPGLSPVSLSERAMETVRRRQGPTSSWYFDLTLIGHYWGGERAYHHTAPVNMLYALHEALALVLEEGLEARIARHALNHRALRALLAELALPFLDEPAKPAMGDYVHETTRAWGEQVSNFDAMIFVVAEYNGGYTAQLKNAIDTLYAEWNDLPIGVVGYGYGAAARAVTALEPVLATVKAIQVPGPGLVITQHVSADGEILDAAPADEVRALFEQVQAQIPALV